MQIRHILAGLTLGICSVVSVQAQDILPEAMPARPVAEKIIREVAPLGAAVETELPTPVRATAYSSSFGESVVKTALQYLGARYGRGSMGPNRFDCSGFTSYVYRQENVPILRDSRSQFTQGTPIASISDLKKGDLVFFSGSSRSSRVGHVGIVTEVDPASNKFSFVHASSSQGVTVSESRDAYYSRRYIGARRIVTE